MKTSHSIILVVLVCFVIAVGYNVTSIQSKVNDEFLDANSVSLVIDVASRLGLGQSLAIIGNVLTNPNVASIWQDERVLRELLNVLYDRYAPIKLPLVLDVSKEVGWFLVQNRVNTTNSATVVSTKSSGGYAYIQSDALNVRSGPSADNRVITTLGKNTRVAVISKSGTWWKIKYGNVEGYVNSQYLGNSVRSSEIPIRSVNTTVNAASSDPDPDPNAGTTRAREYQERWQYYHDKVERENPGTVPKELLEAAKNTFGATYIEVGD
jgi:uncharacterized protein YgiM (DUF1202 family)